MWQQNLSNLWIEHVFLIHDVPYIIMYVSLHSNVATSTGSVGGPAPFSVWAETVIVYIVCDVNDVRMREVLLEPTIFVTNVDCKRMTSQ